MYVQAKTEPNHCFYQEFNQFKIGKQKVQKATFKMIGEANRAGPLTRSTRKIKSAPEIGIEFNQKYP